MGGSAPIGCRRCANRSLWWFTLAAQLTIVAQVILGVLVVTSEEREAPQFHMFYGSSPWPRSASSTATAISSRPTSTCCTGGGLFLMGLAIRAMVIGPHR